VFEHEVGIVRAVRLGFSRIDGQITDHLICLSDRLGLKSTVAAEHPAAPVRGRGEERDAESSASSGT